jgi:hypothetical protein
MTTRFKDFGTGGLVATEPVSFKLYGEDFECRTALQGKAILEMAALGSGDNVGGSASAITTFFERALKEESYNRFQKLLDDPDKIVSVESLAEIAGWLVEQYSGRPIPGPEQSVSGQ